MNKKFLSSWLREDLEGIEERRKDMDKKAREEESRSGKREVEREEEIEECRPMDDSGSFGDSCSDLCGDSCGFSECVPVAIDLSVSPSVGVLGEVSLSVSDCEFVKSRSISFSRKRRAFHVESQGDINAASSLEDVQPLSRRRTQEMDCGVLSYLDHSDVLRIGAPCACTKRTEG